MNYSLGNMLSRGGSLNADKLSLDLQFATDKSLTARKGPTPTFTRASTATFVGSDGLIQSAAINAARFDHDPVTLACKGLLIEESRTNLFLRSEEFNTSAWTKNQSSVTADAGNAPNGLLTADKIIPNTTNTGHNVFQLRAGSGGSVTASCFVKPAGYNFTSLQVTDNGTTRHVIIVDLTTGTITQTQSSGSPTGISTSVTPSVDGWYRISLTMNVTAVNIFMLVCAVPTSTASFNGSLDPSFAGDGTSGILVWGAQLEAGSFATSYIPTVASSVVRSADVCSITGASFTGMYNATEGSVTAQFNLFAAAADPSFQGIFELSDGTTNNRMRSSRSTILIFRNTTSGSTNVDINAGVIQANTVHKAAYGFALNSFALVANNGTVITDNAATMPTGVNVLELGNNPVSSSTRLNGHLASFRYYKKRLSDVKLKALTV
jgi:hypothetical protein